MEDERILTCPNCASNYLRKISSVKHELYGDMELPVYKCKDCGNVFHAGELGNNIEIGWEIVEYTDTCHTCKEEKEITKISNDSHIETVEFSCGHKHVKITVVSTIRVKGFVQAKHSNPQGDILSKYRTKESGETKRPSKEELVIDRKNRRIKHKIEEQSVNGSWTVVHEEEKPFPKKK